MTTKPRIPPLPRAEWTDSARDIFALIGPPETREARREAGSPANLDMVMANHPALATAFYGFGMQLLLGSSLPDRPREIVTLRVAWRYQAAYEWAHHTRFARALGFTEAEIAAVKDGPAAALWSDEDRTLLRAVDQLCEHTQIDDETWAALANRFDRHQMMDLVFTIGHYVMLAMALSAFGVEVEEAYRTPETALV